MARSTRSMRRSGYGLSQGQGGEEESESEEESQACQEEVSGRCWLTPLRLGQGAEGRLRAKFRRDGPVFIGFAPSEARRRWIPSQWGASVDDGQSENPRRRLEKSNRKGQGRGHHPALRRIAAPQPRSAQLFAGAQLSAAPHFDNRISPLKLAGRNSGGPVVVGIEFDHEPAAILLHFRYVLTCHSSAAACS